LDTASEWTPTTLGDLVHLQKGVSYKGEFLDGPGPKLLGMGTFVLGGGLDLAKARTYAGPIAQKQLVRPGDVVLAVVGISQRGSVVGSPGLVPKGARGDFAFTHHVMRVEPLRRGTVDPTYLYYVLRSKSFQQYVLAVQGGSTVPEIKAVDILAYTLKLPSLTAQEEIGRFLSSLDGDIQARGADASAHGLKRFLSSLIDRLTTGACTIAEALAWLSSEGELVRKIDDKIELNRRMNSTLEEIARALFRFWFVDFGPVRAKAEGRWKKGESLPGMPADMWDLWPSGFEESEIGEIPKGWRVAGVGGVVAVAGGSTPSTKNPRFWDGPIHWATPKDMAGLSAPALLDTERKLTDAGLAETTSGLLPRGTVLLSSRAPIGYLAITEVPVAVNQGFITMTCGTNPSNHYMLHWARENHEAIIAQANGTTFLEISKGNFRPMKILVPNDELMSKFTQIAQSFHEHVVASLRQTETLASVRDTLLPKLLSGELRISLHQSA